jgi:hypothetical protein
LYICVSEGLERLFSNDWGGIFGKKPLCRALGRERGDKKPRADLKGSLCLHSDGSHVEGWLGKPGTGCHLCSLSRFW